jgi:hypothetical protein
VMCNIGAELLAAAVQEDLATLDDALFLRVFGRAGAA